MLVAAFGIALVRGGATVKRGSPSSRWHAMAQACGLSDISPPDRFSGSVSGRLGDLIVGFRSAREGVATAVTVHGLAKFVVVKREGLGTRIDKALSGGDLQTGHQAFDEAVYVRGDRALLLALLDHETRGGFLSTFSMLVRGGASATMELERGELRVVFPSGSEEPDAVRTILELAQRLREPPDPVARLVANLEREPLPSARRAILDALDQSESGRPQARSAMERTARLDDDAGLRLRAALWLGRDGWPVLQELAEDSTAPDAVSERAIKELGGQVALDLARRIVERSLPSGRTLTARAAVNVLGGGGAAEVGFLTAVMERAALQAARESLIAAAWDELAAAAARALGRTGAASAEEPLLRALTKGRAELQVAAADALGQVGSAASIEPLRELVRSASGFVQRPHSRRWPASGRD